MRTSTITLYGGLFGDELFKAVLNKISDEVSHQTDEHFLALDTNTYAQQLEQKYFFDIPIIEFDKAYAEVIERDIPASRFPPKFAVFEGKSYKREVIIYHLPYSGDIDILGFKPNTFSTFSGYAMQID